MLNFIENAYKFSADFNEQIYLRYCLWKNGKFNNIFIYCKIDIFIFQKGFMYEMKQLPGLLKQERESFYCILLINYKTYKMYKSINYSQVQKYLDNFIE